MPLVAVKPEHRAIPELSIDTQELERLLRTVPIGETVSYRALSEKIGRDVQAKARGVLTSARRRLLNNERIAFGSVFGVGLKRMSDTSIAGGLGRHTQRIRRTCQRGQKEAACIENFDALSPGQQQDVNLQRSLFGLLGNITKPAIIDKIAKALPSAPSMPMAKLLDRIKESL